MKKTLTLRLIFFLSFIYFSHFSYGQTDACGASSTLITSNGSCLTGNTSGFTDSNVGCTAGTEDDDGWFRFVAAATSHTITVDGAIGFDAVLGVFTNCSGTTATGGGCVDNSFDGGVETVTVTGLTIGNTYYISVHDYYAGSGSNFQICVTHNSSTPPANDACASATSLPCGTSNLAGTTANAVLEAAVPTCSMSQYGVWYTFAGNGQNTTITVSGGTLDAEMGIYSGSCGSLSNITCQDVGFSGGTETFTFFAANGTNYFVYVGYYGSGTTTGTFNISRTCAAAPTPPANDACAGATSLPCGTSNLAGTTANAVLESAVPTCSMSQYGVWYAFTGDGQQTTITVSGGTLDAEMAIFSGSCGSFSNLACVDNAFSGGNETFTFTTTNGTNYYVYVGYYGSGTTTGTFNISRTCTAAPTPPANDACAGATTLACGVTNLAGTTVNSTFEALPPTCFTTSNYGVWYTFTGDGQGSTITVTATGGFDTGIGIYSGSCGSLTSLYCLDSWGGSETQTFATTNGVQYYIYVSYYDDWYSTTGTFTISRTCAPVSSCGTPATNDYCASPALLTEGPGTFSANTSSTFTADIVPPSFCGSVENNSWYQFVANSTTETFPIASVTGCTNGWGIQAHVYSVGYTAAGCCSSFTSTSNCYNPGNTTLGTVTASGLTIGNTYILMIDGNAGDDCDFTISGWTATGILPVEFISLDGSAEEFGDLITWSTASETNNKQFDIHHSKDGTNFSKIGEVGGAINSNSRRDYSFINENPNEGTNYYFIEQVDLNGHKIASSMIQVTRWNLNEAIIKVYPNPTNDNAFFEYYSESDRKINYRLMNYIGETMEENSALITKGTSIFPITLQSLPSGIYILEINSDDESNTIKIIKN
jgi:hypothetical protein